MYALIKYNGKEYCTPIIGEILKGWRSKVICFNDNFSDLIVINYWEHLSFLSPRIRTAYIFDINSDGWISKGDIRGIPELFENNNLNLIINKKASQNLIDKCKIFIKEITPNDWITLINERDAASFLELSGYLHDAHIDKIITKNNDLHLYIDATWQLKLEIHFFEVKEFIIPDGIIFFDCEIEFKDGMIYFIPIETYKTNENDPDAKIICEKIEYKISNYSMNYYDEILFNIKKTNKGEVSSDGKVIYWTLGKMRLDIYVGIDENYISIKYQKKPNNWKEISHLHINSGYNMNYYIREIGNVDKKICIKGFLGCKSFNIVDKNIRKRKFRYYSN